MSTNLSRRTPTQRLVNTGMAVILQEPAEFAFQVPHVPKEDAVKYSRRLVPTSRLTDAWDWAGGKLNESNQ